MSADLFAYVTDSRYYIPIFIAVGIYLILWVLKNVLVTRLKRISASTETYLDDVVLTALDHTRQFFMLGLALYMGFHVSPFENSKTGPIAYKLLMVIFAAQVLIWGSRGITTWFECALQRRNNDPGVKTSFGFLSLLIKVAFVVAVGLFALNNLGVNVSTFIAGLGVGGIAIALATQNILGDLFSSLSIVLDKPFIVGDFINLGEWMGTVEHVGLKTTRIRSLGGEQIIVSNSDLLSSKIRNYKRMQERRVVFQIGVTYKTKRETLKLLPKVIQEIITREPKARFERAHFVRYGVNALEFEIVYWVTVPDYLAYADIQQGILLEIHEAFEKLGVEFALPIQTVKLTRES